MLVLLQPILNLKTAYRTHNVFQAIYEIDNLHHLNLKSLYKLIYACIITMQCSECTYRLSYVDFWCPENYWFKPNNHLLNVNLIFQSPLLKMYSFWWMYIQFNLLLITGPLTDGWSLAIVCAIKYDFADSGVVLGKEHTLCPCWFSECTITWPSEACKEPLHCWNSWVEGRNGIHRLETVVLARVVQLAFIGIDEFLAERTPC